MGQRRSGDSMTLLFQSDDIRSLTLGHLPKKDDGLCYVFIDL